MLNVRIVADFGIQRHERIVVYSGSSDNQSVSRVTMKIARQVIGLDNNLWRECKQTNILRCQRRVKPVFDWVWQGDFPASIKQCNFPTGDDADAQAPCSYECLDNACKQTAERGHYASTKSRYVCRVRSSQNFPIFLRTGWLKGVLQKNNRKTFKWMHCRSG